MDQIDLRSPTLTLLLLGGRRFHPWISQLHQLVRLGIIDYNYCRRLPSIHQLALLKSLHLMSLGELEYIEVEGSNRSSTFFPSLEVVQMESLSNFKGLQCLQGNSSEVNDIHDEDENFMLLVFPKKIEVHISDCPKFSYLGHGENLILINVNEKHIHKLVRNSEVQTPQNKEVTAISLLISLSFVPTTELKFLRIEGMGSVEVLPKELFHSLNSLRRLEIVNGQHLKSLPWRAILSYLPGLEHLEILDCPELDLPSILVEEVDLQQQYGHMNGNITSVSICGVKPMSGQPWWFQHLSGLEILRIDCYGLEALSEIVYYHTSLREVTLSGCRALKSLSRSMILHLITTLEKWGICDCKELDLNGELDGESDDIVILQLSRPFTLRELTIKRSEAQFLPWWIKHLNNLEVLRIEECENLKALPKWFSELTSLKSLWIWECPLITKRCKESGPDLPKISHIECIIIHLTLRMRFGQPW